MRRASKSECRVCAALRPGNVRQVIAGPRVVGTCGLVHGPRVAWNHTTVFLVGPGLVDRAAAEEALREHPVRPASAPLSRARDFTYA